MIADGTDAAVAALTGEDGTRPEALAARAHEIVLADHTGRARAAELAHMLQECPESARRREREETSELT